MSSARTVLALVLLLLLPAAAQARPARVHWKPAAPVDGDPVLFEVRPHVPATSVSGTFLGRPLGFFPWGEGRWRALAPVPLDTPPGDHPLVLTLHTEAGPVEDVRPVTVRPGAYRESRLRVAPEYVEPPEAVRERLAADRAAVDAALAASAERRLWQGTFQRPSDRRQTAPYGTRRTFNGNTRSRHRGLDLAGPIGDPVRATAAGRVVLAADLYLSGNTVLIDHGLGLHSAYFHLSELSVPVGREVAAGEVVGKVGDTGRVTGPHLHFGIKLDGSYVNPATLLALDLADDPAPGEGGAPPAAQAAP